MLESSSSEESDIDDPSCPTETSLKPPTGI